MRAGLETKRQAQKGRERISMRPNLEVFSSSDLIITTSITQSDDESMVTEEQVSIF